MAGKFTVPLNPPGVQFVVAVPSTSRLPLPSDAKTLLKFTPVYAPAEALVRVMRNVVFSPGEIELSAPGAVPTVTVNSVKRAAAAGAAAPNAHSAARPACASQRRTLRQGLAEFFKVKISGGGMRHGATSAQPRMPGATQKNTHAPTGACKQREIYKPKRVPGGTSAVVVNV